MRFTGTALNAGDIIVWVQANDKNEHGEGANGNGSIVYHCEPGDCKHGPAGHYLRLVVGADIMEIRAGDFVARGIDGKFYRIPGDTFMELYESIPRCQHSVYAGALEPPEQCENDAVIGETLCEDHLHDESDRHDSMRKGE